MRYYITIDETYEDFYEILNFLKTTEENDIFLNKSYNIPISESDYNRFNDTPNLYYDKINNTIIDDLNMANQLSENRRLLLLREDILTITDEIVFQDLLGNDTTALIAERDLLILQYNGVV